MLGSDRAIEERIPDLPEIMATANVGLTQALALWSQFMNTPGMTSAEARIILAELNKTTKH